MPEAFVTSVQPALEFIPPQFSGPVRWAVHRALPWWLHNQLNIQQIDTENVETLAQLYQQFRQKKTRLILAFRHPQTTDPFCMAHLLWNAIPNAARTQGFAIDTPHCHFMYDRGIPLWAGKWVTWLLSRLGGTPIMRGKVDRPGLKSARDILLNGRFPLAIAPEGATNNHSEIVSPLEPGVAQLAFWCDGDLRKEERPEQVLVVPIGLQYGYIHPPWDAIDQLLKSLEADLKITYPPQAKNASVAETRYLRLYGLGETMLDLMENFYRQFYQRSLPPVEATDPNQKFAQRLQNLLDATLTVAEDYLAVKPRGSVGDRCRRLEQAGWDRIYRDNLTDLSPVERGLADWVAREASSRMGHMRLVERFTAVTGKYVREKPSAERFAETLLIVWRVSQWIQGQSPSTPPQLGAQRVWIRVGNPINVSDRHSAYQQNRRAAISELTETLQHQLESLIR